MRFISDHIAASMYEGKSKSNQAGRTTPTYSVVCAAGIFDGKLDKWIFNSDRGNSDEIITVGKVARFRSPYRTGASASIYFDGKLLDISTTAIKVNSCSESDVKPSASAHWIGSSGPYIKAYVGCDS